MSQPAIADAGTVIPEADPEAAQVPMPERLALGPAERPCGAGEPHPVTSVPVTKTEESKMRVTDETSPVSEAVMLGVMAGPVKVRRLTDKEGRKLQRLVRRGEGKGRRASCVTDGRWWCWHLPGPTRCR